MIDACGRSIDYLRISITDRCNLRCVYCMPEGIAQPFSHDEVLRYEEIVRLVRLMTGLGVKHLRITGGEPTVRRHWLCLLKMLGALPGIETMALTTNALLLDGCVEQVKAAGITALNISIDSLEPDTYRRMTRGGDVAKVLRVVDDAVAAGLRVKLNAVPVRGMNEDGLVDLALMAKDRPIDVRFIELMPIGCGRALAPIASDEVLRRMEAAFGPLTRDDTVHGFGPAQYSRPAGFQGSIGIISPITHEFCDRCNRVRLTADGYLKLCLNHTAGLDLRAMLRGGAEDEALRCAIREAIAHKPDRHGWYDPIVDRENRRMNAIGG